MGKIVVFWSPVQGSGRVTSCTAAVACDLGVLRGKKVALTQVPDERCGIEEMFDSCVPEELKKEIYLKNGLKALWMRFRQEKLDREKIRHCALKTSSETIDLFPCGRGMAIEDEKTRRAVTALILNELKKAYDYVLIDARAGERDECTKAVISASDAFVCLLTQSDRRWRDYFSKYDEDCALEKTVYVINGYMPESGVTMNRLKSQVKPELKGRKTGMIPLSAAFMDAVSSGRTDLFFRQNNNISHEDHDHEFFEGVAAVCDLIDEVCEN